MTGVAEPRQLDAVEVAGNFFPTLGVTPVLGRNFSEEETLKGGRPAALLSYYFWRTQFGADLISSARQSTSTPAPLL